MIVQKINPKSLWIALVCTLFSIQIGTSQCNDLYIAGVIDGPLTGGTPKGVQLCASSNIPDLGIFGIGSANNGGGSDGEEFMFSSDAALNMMSLTAGECIWIASEAIQFENWFGFAPCATNGAANINGDDAIELFCNGSVVDVFGDINTDGTGETWEYLDGWATASDMTQNTTFTDTEWTYSSPNALDGETTNASATTGYPTPTSNCPMASTCADFTVGTISCESMTSGAGNDTWMVEIDFTDGGTDTYTITPNDGSVAASSDDPDSDATGTITIEGISEGTNINFTITSTGGCSIPIMATEPDCEPAGNMAQIEVSDPCNCFLGADTDGDTSNGNELALETITITAAAGQTITLTNAASSGLVDMTGNALTGTPTATDNGDGTYTFQAYLPADGSTTYDAMFTISGGGENDGETPQVNGGPCAVCPVICSIDVVSITPTCLDNGFYDLEICLDFINPLSTEIVVNIDGHDEATISYPASSGDCITIAGLDLQNAGDGTSGVMVEVRDAASVVGPVASPIFISEIHYNDTSGDMDEQVEITAPAGTDLTGWTVVLYNGSSTQLSTYATINLSGTVGDDGDGCGALSFLHSGIQNGDPDGLALVDNTGMVIEFLSYGGAFTAANGPAMGMMSTDIGVTESGNVEGMSLSLTDDGWQPEGTPSFGSVNGGLTCVESAESCTAMTTYDEPVCPITCAVPTATAVATCVDDNAGNDADMDEYYVEVEISAGTGPFDIMVNDGIIGSGTTGSAGESIASGLAAGTYFLGPFTHSGDGKAVLSVMVLDTDNDCPIFLTVSETVCGYSVDSDFDSDGSDDDDLHASGAACLCTDGGPISMVGLLLAQAEPGSFDAETTKMVYVLTDENGLVVADGNGNHFNSTGLFEMADNGSYQIHAFNVAIADCATFEGEIPAVGEDITAFTPTACADGCTAPAEMSLECFCCDAEAGTPMGPAGPLEVCEMETIGGFFADFSDPDEMDHNEGFDFDIPLKINELDTDQSGSDAEEFIELSGMPGASLDGYVLILFNGNGNVSYNCIDLDGHTIGSDGLFVVGNIAGADIGISPATGWMQNGADGVGIYMMADCPPNGFAATTTDLITALVYGTNDADDTDLLADLGLTTQYNETTSTSINCDPTTGMYMEAAPTPGTTANPIGPEYSYIWIVENTADGSIVEMVPGAFAPPYEVEFSDLPAGDLCIHGLQYQGTFDEFAALGYTSIMEITDAMSAGEICSDIDPGECIPLTVIPGPPTPTNPVSQAYCPTDEIPLLSVDDPGSPDYTITWWDAPAGGNMVTGATISGPANNQIMLSETSMPPVPAPGGMITIYAQAEDNTGNMCTNLERVPVVLMRTLGPPAPEIEDIFVCDGESTVIDLTPDDPADLLLLTFDDDGVGATGPCAMPVESCDMFMPPTDGSWTLAGDFSEMTAGSDWFVTNGGELEARDVGNEICFLTAPVYIGAYGTVDFSIDVSSAIGNHEASDYVDITIIIDGVPMMIPDWMGNGDASHTLIDDWTDQVVTMTGISGTSVQIEICVLNNGGTETYSFDNISLLASNPTVEYRYYDGDPANGGNLITTGNTYDPGTTVETNPDTVWVTCYDGLCESLADEVLIVVGEPGAIACNDNINLSLDADCCVVVDQDMLVEGGNIGNFEITLTDGNGNVIPDNTVCAEHIGIEIKYQVTNLCGGNSCWGYLNVEDKLPPFLDEEDEDLCGDLGVIGTCADINDIDCLLGDPYDLNVVECGTYELFVNYDYEHPTSSCDDITVTRTVSANYPLAHGGVGSVVICETTAQLSPMTLDELVCPVDTTMKFPCGFDMSPANIASYFDNPNTAVNEGYDDAYPHIINSCGTIEPILPQHCNLLAGYSDLVVDVCGNSQKVRRTWTVIDWCSGENTNCFQTFSTKDEEAPVVVADGDILVGQRPWLCTGTHPVPPLLHITDNCSENFAVEVYFADAQGGIIIGDYENGAVADEILLGNQDLVYKVTDECGNVGYDTLTFLVGDHSVPQPICHEEINVSLTFNDPNIEHNIYYDYDFNTEGLAIITPDMLDAGSHDAGCGDVYFKVLRNDFNFGCFQIFYDDFSPVCCGDDQVEVTLRVFDVDPGPGPVLPFRMVSDAEFADWDIPAELGLVFNDLYGHFSDCVVTVNIDRKLPPTIICPPAVTVLCEAEIDPYVNHDMGFAEVEGLCADYQVAYVDYPSLDACGTGFIDRQWFIDFNGNGELDFTLDELTYQCNQIISIDEQAAFDPYSIRWPNHYIDGSSAFSLSDGYPSATNQEFGYSSTACGAWAYEGALTCPDDVSDVPTWEDPACSLVGWGVKTDTFYFEDNSCIKIVKRWTIVDWCTWDPNGTDFDDIPDDTNDQYPTEYITPILVLVDNNGNGLACNDEVDRYIGYGNDGAGTVELDGYYTYDQVIKIVDEDAPIVDCEDRMEAVDANCRHELVISNSATDDGACPSAWLKWDIQVFDHEWNPLDNYTAVSAPGEEVTINVATTDGDDAGSAAEGYVGPGIYRVTWKVEDGCGNYTSCTEEIMVADKKPPTPYCYSGISTATMKPGGFVEIWAVDFDRGSVDNCSPQENLIFSFSQDPTETSRTFYCDQHLGDNFLQIWVTDEQGNQDFCNVILNINAGENCDDGNNITDINGKVLTELGHGVEGVSMNIMENGQMVEQDLTQLDGRFAFNDMTMLSSYIIQPEKTDNANNGVSTLDLAIIQKHILGQQILDSPYKIIAADANNDSRITANDIVQLRKLILGDYEILPNNDSWRFVDGEFVFENEQIPFPFDESLTASEIDEDNSFIGVKIGDVNMSGTPNSGMNSTEIRTNPVELDYKIISKDEKIVANILPNQTIDNVVGMQFTLHFDPNTYRYDGVEDAYLAVNGNNIGVRQLQEGILTFSYHQSASFDLMDEVLFALVFTTDKSNENLSLTLNDSNTSAEIYQYSKGIYTTSSLTLRKGEETMDNMSSLVVSTSPNPFSNSSELLIESVTDQQNVDLLIKNVDGRIVFTNQINLKKGTNVFTINREDIGNAGVYYYTIQTEKESITRSIILLN